MPSVRRAAGNAGAVAAAAPATEVASTLPSPARGGGLLRASSATSFGPGGAAVSPETSGSTQGQKRKSMTNLEKYEKDALRSIQDYLIDNRSEILTVKEKLLSGQLSNKKRKDEDAREKTCFDSSYMSFRQVPKYFFGDVLVSLCGFTVEQVDLINSAERQSIRYMASYFFGIHDSDYLPRPCLQKATLSVFLHNRGVALGKRWEGFKATAVNAEGEIDWNKRAAYTLKWAEDGLRVASIVHNSSGKEAPVNTCNVTKGDDWEVLELYCDKKASFRQASGDFTVLLSSFFGNAKSEWLSHMTKQKMQADAVAAEVEVNAKTAMFVKGDLATLATAQKQDQEKRQAARKQRKAPNAAMSIALEVE